MQNNSRFIAIEGLDGAGKSTQITLLTAYFNKQGIETRFVHFPIVQEGIFGELIAKLFPSQTFLFTWTFPSLSQSRH
jgi:dTMP kinase